MKRLAKSIELFLHKVYDYPQLLKFPEFIIFILFDLLGLKRVRQVKMADQTIYLRTATTDVYVAASCLISKEFAGFKCDNPSVIINAGAHIGIASVWFAQKYPNAKIIAIEPDRDNYEMMRRNAENYKNVITIHAALWSSRGKRELLDRQTGTWGYTIADTENVTKSTGQMVDCVSIPSLMDEYNFKFIDLLKLDIEGSEKEVLESSSAWMKNVGAIMIELHDRIAMGCSRAFYLAARDFKHYEMHGENVIAYRK